MPGYKRSDVGVIPEDWDVLPLGECLISRPGYGINAAAVPYSDALPVYIRITDISEDGRFSPDKLVSVKSEQAGNYHLSDGDIVFARTGASVGKSYRYDTKDGPLVFAGFLIRVRPDTNKLLPAFAAAYITTGNYWRWVRFMSMRSGQPGINGNEYSQLPIPLPLLPEQRAIAQALSDVDELLATLDQVIVKKRDLKQATMQQLLTGKTRLPGFSGGWEDVTMRQVLIQNATYGIVTAGNFVQNGVKMLRGGDIADSRINTEPPMVTHEKSAEYGRTALVKDDVVIALVGYPGATAKIPDELIGANISRAVGLLRLNHKVSADFLVCFLNSPDGRRMVLAPSAGSAQQVVNLAALNKLQFSVPPPPEQVAIANVLTEMDDELAVLESRKEKTRNIKQAMMQELLTGKTRLVHRGLNG